jgi:formylglycine-generating enzyme required for sulfatase activity
MKVLSIFVVAAFSLAPRALSHEAPDNFVLVEGGQYKSTHSNNHGLPVTISDFSIGRYEVTQKEWTDVMATNPSQFRGTDLPVESVSWYDCIDYCNKRSAKAGLQPYYNVDKNKKDPNNATEFDNVKWMVTTNPQANGYRLPTEAEWEYAASGGQLSEGYVFSGSQEVDDVAWYWQNSGDRHLTGAWNWPRIEANRNRSKPVGSKAPNELGLYDMSGNVREWCFDWYGDGPGTETGARASSRETGRVWKGGGWMGGDHCCAPSFRSSFEASGRGPDHGLRVCRSAHR